MNEQEIEMQKLTASQKKINITAIVMVLIFLSGWLLIYFPRQNKLRQLKNELSRMEGQIQQINALLGDNTTIDEGIRLFTERSRRLDAQFPHEEEEPIRWLSDSARKHNLGIVSIKSQPKILFQDEKQKPIEVEGKSCQVVGVSMEIKGSYRDLIEYMESIKKSLPTYVTVEKVRIYKDSSATGALNFSVEMRLFLLS